MAACGELTPMPEAAIFADTGDEPASVYRWLAWLEKQLPFPVIRVSAGILSEKATTVRVSKKSRSPYLTPAIPTFFTGGSGKGKRQCTTDHKIKPIRKALRKMRAKRPVIQWIGISLDEVQRMKMSRDPWCTNIFPLIDREMRRGDCLLWMEAHNYPKPPRSACVYCPFHSNAEWRRLRDEQPVEFERAAQFEERLQAASAQLKDYGTPFLHRSCVPLRQVDLSTDVERGQSLLAGFNNECEGMCGL